MHHPWHDIDPGNPEQPLAFVEIPKGTKTKYEMDKSTGLMIVSRVMFSSFVYPFNYGFVPRTLADDDDPLDCFIMGEEVLVQALVEMRPIGTLRMTDEGRTDDKVLAVPVGDPRFEPVLGLEHVAPHYLRELEHFLAHYKDLEDKKTIVTTWIDREGTCQLIRESFDYYRRAREAGRMRTM
jgi:inorganic pyrophosphatase